MESVEKLWVDKNFHVAVLIAVVIVFLCVLLKLFKVAFKSEHATDGGTLGAGLQQVTGFTSGATMRFGQELSATNQGANPVHLVDLPDSITNPPPAKKDKLTGMRESPVFWEIGDELAAYRYGQNSDGTSSVQDVGDVTAAERMENPLAGATDLRLTDLLHPGYASSMLS